MNLHTPRRRISPRTKRRYRAIREFFRRALGSPLQPDITISSSIAINDTDLKRHKVGNEQQLDEVNRHWQNITCLDCSSRESEVCFQTDVRPVQESNCCIPTNEKHEIRTISEQTEPSSASKLNSTYTKLLHKSPNVKCGKSSNWLYGRFEDSEHICKTHSVIDETQTQEMNDDYEKTVSKAQTKKSKLHRLSDYSAKLHKYRTRSVSEKLASANSSSSFRSLMNPRMHRSHTKYIGHYHGHNIKYLKQEPAEPVPLHYQKENKYTERARKRENDVPKESFKQNSNITRKHNNRCRELDQGFIADIIRRQYRPVKMFGRKQSEFSQISAPVCRDQEYSIREDIQEGSGLWYSYYYGGQKHRRKPSDLSEMRSICDTRLYSSKKHAQRKHRRGYVYNHSDVYDFIPVKEKSSPKTRQKFSEDDILPYEYYREVPPSPRTLRPQLNLKSQYNYEYADNMALVKHSYKKVSPYRRSCQRKRIQLDSDVISEQVPYFIKKQPRKTCHAMHMPYQVEKPGHRRQDNDDDDATMSSSQYVPLAKDQVDVAVDATFNKTEAIIREEIRDDKSDKALYEIKDILQTFLDEIKKDTIAPQCDKNDVSSKTEDNGNSFTNENSVKLHGSAMPDSRRHSINNFDLCYTSSPYMSSRQNPCCYPMMPVCPMSYPMTMQNGYMMPNPSYTCTNCVNTTTEPAHNENSCNKDTTTSCDAETSHTETENLIKEIYKFVAQGPARKKYNESSFDRHETRKAKAKIFTSRSVGESMRLTNSKHDVKVGTPPLKCYSKSCEAIGSRMGSEPYISGTNASYSDTILEKLGLQVTQSTSETELETTTTEDKSKRQTFSNVLRSFGILKKKKKDCIEELSESESAIDVQVKPRSPRASHNPYRQQITNYMMHGQEYYHPPPMPSNYPRPNEYQPVYNLPYNPPYNLNLPDYAQPPPLHDMYAPRAQHPSMREPAAAPPYPSQQWPIGPPLHTYDNPNNRMQQPQAPLCLKETEIKNISTQSEKKFSIFRNFKKKMQRPADVQVDDNQNTCSTQTQALQPIRQQKKPLINWKKLQAKAIAEHYKLDTDPMDFSQKTGKELAGGDLKIRKAMLNKLFYKRNPFSPRNLIVRTLLGKDPSSFGNPQTNSVKPRMFL